MSADTGPVLHGPSRAKGHRLVLAGVLCLAGAVLYAISELPAESPQSHAARLSARYGIQVSLEDPSSFHATFMPGAALPDGYTATPAEASAAAIALRGIEESLATYPHGVVANLIDAILICGDLRFRSIPSGGTLGSTWIVLSAPRSLNDESILLTARLGLHHELSSIVYRRSPATQRAWADLTPTGWRAVDTPEEGLARADDRAPDPASGFLSAYASTDLENDFNTYAERLFSQPAELRALAQKYSAVRAKLNVVLAAYEALDKKEFRRIFQRLGLR